MDKRISGKRLESVQREISGRDRDILLSLQKCRYLTTSQIQRLHFNDSATNAAALRAANRALAKLKGYGLISSIARRIGGVRAGSGSFVWNLESAGIRLLHLMSGPANAPPRKRLFEPSPRFLEHTLAVAEAFLQLYTMSRATDTELLKTQLEPECWRKCRDENGKPAILKPDLFVTTASGEYEDNWFFEIDLATEAPVKILGKCQKYAAYYKSGAEQKKNGVFPFVVWITPSVGRKNSVQRHIREQFKRGPDVFITITPDELERLIAGGAEKFIAQSKQEGDQHD
jgi:hypothetical protein